METPRKKHGHTGPTTPLASAPPPGIAAGTPLASRNPPSKRATVARLPHLQVCRGFMVQGRARAGSHDGEYPGRLGQEGRHQPASQHQPDHVHLLHDLTCDPRPRAHTHPPASLAFWSGAEIASDSAGGRSGHHRPCRPVTANAVRVRVKHRSGVSPGARHDRGPGTRRPRARSRRSPDRRAEFGTLPAVSSSPAASLELIRAVVLWVRERKVLNEKWKILVQGPAPDVRANDAERPDR